MKIFIALQNEYPGPREIPGLYTGAIQWQYNTFQPISLWQLMDYFSSHEFMKAIREVYAYELELKRSVEELGNWDKEFPDWENKEVNELLSKVEASFNPQEFPQTFNVVKRVYAFANSKCTHHELYMRVVALREAMEDELRGRKLVFIAGLKGSYCDKKDAFGEQVSIAFPSAQFDILNAGNCYAVGLNTACVFHLMRVLERGLRALCHDLGLPYKTEAWGGILKDIESAIEEVQAQGRNSPKWANLHFYSEFAIEFRYIKDAWRNYVMHAQESYDEQRAKTIMEHVHNFMQRLAEKLSDVV
jgi:hypothetical protein